MLLKKIKIILIIVGICCFPMISLAQVFLSGRIVDKKTNEPVVGASVYIRKNQAGDNANDNGLYRIKLPQNGTYFIEVSFIGYKTIKHSVTVNGNTTKDFFLEENTETLSEVVVRASSLQAKINHVRKSPMAVSVIDGAKLRGRAGGIEEVLTKTSGLKIRKTGGLGSQSKISIHGLEGKRVSVFMNGFALNSPDGSFDINDIPIDIIERIEVYKGIVPAEFGGDCLGGAINIVTREDDCDLVAFTQEVGSFGLSKTLFSAKKVFEKPGIQVGTGFFYNRAENNYKMKYPIFETDLPSSSYRDVRRNNDFYGAGMLNFQLIFTKLWFDKIELECALYKNKKEIQSLQFDSRSAYSHGTNIMPTLHLEKENFLFQGLKMQATVVSPIVNSHLVDTATTIRQWDGSITNSKGETTDYILNLSNDKQQEIQGQINLSYIVNNRNKLNLNNQFIYSNYKPQDNYVADYIGFDPSGYPSKMKGNIIGLTHEYISKNKRFNNALMFSYYYLNSKVYTSEAIRPDAVKQEPPSTGVHRSYWGASEGICYEILKGIRLKASYSHALRLPDTEELFGDGITTKASVDLQPEKSDNVNLGFIIDKENFWGIHKVQIEGNLYYMNISNMISLFPANTRMIYTNIGKTRIKGFDIDIKTDITSNIYTYFNLTYQDVRDKLKWKTSDNTTKNPTYDKKVPNIPNFYFNYGIEYHKEDLLGKGELSRFYIDASYMHDFDWSWQMSDREDQKHKWLIPGSHIVTIGIQQSFWKNRCSLSGEIENLFNKENYMEYKNPLAGRSFKIKLRFNIFKDQLSGGAISL